MDMDQKSQDGFGALCLDLTFNPSLKAKNNTDHKLVRLIGYELLLQYRDKHGEVIVNKAS